MAVDERDHRWMVRLAADLAGLETDVEPSPARRAELIAWTNDARARAARPPLSEAWWRVPEEEFHRRARALGMVGTDRPGP